MIRPTNDITIAQLSMAVGAALRAVPRTFLLNRFSLTRRAVIIIVGVIVIYLIGSVILFTTPQSIEQQRSIPELDTEGVDQLEKHIEARQDELQQPWLTTTRQYFIQP